MRSTIRPAVTRKSYGRVCSLALALLFTAAVGVSLRGAEDQTKTILKTERVDQDPGSKGLNNRVTLKQVSTVTQEFGYSPTHIAGRGQGEIGGRVQRSTTPAYYADGRGSTTLPRRPAKGPFA